MIEVSSILHNYSPKSLLILDEVGWGISMYDGVSIAWAVIGYINTILAGERKRSLPPIITS